MGWGDNWTSTWKTYVVTKNSVENTVKKKTIFSKQDDVLKTEIIPFMRPIKIDFTAAGLQPFEQVKPYFAGEDVSTFVSNVINGTSLGTSIIADAEGNVEGSFYLPAGKFRTGQTSFVLANDPLVTEATSIAERPFSSIGQIETRQTSNITTNATIYDTNYISSTTSVAMQIVYWARNGYNESGAKASAQKYACSGGDPLAQTFTINTKTDSEFAFVTKVDIFVATKDPSQPLTVELRNIENGYPGGTIFSSKSLNPADINTSVDGSVATTFEFSTPVALPNRADYCIVLKANSTAYTVHVARMGGMDTLNNRAIAKQPNSGVLFQSTNDTTWVAQLDCDLKFDLYVANFSTTGNTKLTTSYPLYKVAFDTKVETFIGTKRIRIFAINHGLSTSKTTRVMVNIKLNAGETTLNGITLANINGVHTVTYVDAFSFEIDVTASPTSATSSGLYDIYRIVYDPILIADAAMVALAGNTPVGTNRSCEFQGVFGRSTDTEPVNLYQKTTLNPVIPLEVIELDQPLAFLNYNTAVQHFGVDAPPTNEVRLTLETSDKYSSPWIDLNRSALSTLTAYLNNTDISSLPSDDQIQETSANTAMNLCRYQTKQVGLELPATSLKVQFAGNIVTGNTVDVYYRTLSSAEDIKLETKGWTQMSITGSFVNASEDNMYYDYEYEVRGIPEFTVFQVKVVCRGTNSVKPPHIKEFRCLALAV